MAGPAVAAFLIAHLLSRRLTDPGSVLYLLDHPNERSLHEHPTPRTGGLAIAAAVLAAGLTGAVLLGGLPHGARIGAGALLVAGISFLDDLSGVRPAWRLAVHAAAAALLVWGGLGLARLALPGLELALPARAGAVLAVLVVVWMVNLYNFMDGMDGFAGGMAVFGFGSFAALGLAAGAPAFAALALLTAAAAGGFLLLNFPPARIFMGDVGSSLLGFLAAALMLWADRAGIFPLWIGVLAFSPFVVDATVTLVLRIARGERVWQAHRTHFYQRLVRLGWGHRRTVSREYALMLACGVSAVAAAAGPAALQWAVLLAWVLAYAILIGCVYRLESARDDGGPRHRDH